VVASVRGLVPALVDLAKRRLVRSGSSRRTGGALRSRLEFAVDGEQATIGVRITRPGYRVADLLFRTRSGGFTASYRFGSPDADGMATARIDLGDLVRRRTLSGTSDIHLTWEQSDQGKTSPKKGPARQRIGGFDDTVRPPCSQRAQIDGVEVRLDVTVNGNLSLRIDDDPGTGVRCTTTEVHSRGRLTELVCDVKTHNRAIVAASTVVFGRISQTRVRLDAPFGLLEDRTREDNGLLHWDVKPQLDLGVLAAAIPETDELIDVSLEVTVEGRDEPLLLTLHLPEELSQHRLGSTLAEHAGRTHVFMPYLTYRTQRLAYRVEHFDAADHRFLRRLLWVAWLFPLVKPFTRIWLIGEVPYKAQDNGLHFFRYLRRAHPRRRAFYIINASSPDREKLLELGNVIDRGSRRHLLYSLLASRLIGSHHAEYLFASRDRPVARHTRGVRIFLQHGITAAKNVTAIYARQGTLELPTERFLVSSELERRIVIEDYGYRPSQVAVTGFARFDALFAAHEPPSRMVLVMPTWRGGLRRHTFEDTDYFKSWHGFLTDPRLQRLVVDNDLHVTLVLHPNLRVFADFFALPNVQLIRQDDVDVQSLITSSAVLVTDFSSVSWDFSFLRRPVIYFQFDQHLLNGSRAPHIDFAEQLPGPVVTTTNRLIEELGSVVGRGCTMDDEYWQRARAFLSYRDQHNCERILSVVDRAWGPSTVFERLRNLGSAQRAQADSLRPHTHHG
jgi:CDP-glycerol glycerophosphotransferase (TagB/SpsB family)